MLAKKQRGLIQRPVSVAVNMPAPTGGWNARDVLSEMAPNDAVILENWFPSTTSVNQRYGYSEWATGLPASVETLIAYAGPASDQLFAACGTEIYDVTTAGALGAAVASGFTSAYWSYTTVSNIGGNVLIMVNGADAGQSYNGTAWSAWSITGVASTALNFVTVWKRRL